MGRFNPLTNEADMFKVLIGAVLLCLALVVLTLLARAVF